MTIWLNGALWEEDEARIDPADRGFLLADGLFETMRAAQGQIMHRARHLARLRIGAAALGLNVPFDDDALATAMAAVLMAQDLTEASLRLTVTAGVGPRGLLRPAELHPSVMITAAALPPALPPAVVILAQSTRRNEHSPLSRVKALGYGDQILARREANLRGADDAILLNTAGELVCATAANLLLHDGTRWLTPPLASGALPGIGRGVLIEAGELHERALRPADLAGAAQLALNNALGLRVVASVAGRVLAPRPDLIAPLLRALRDPDIARTPF